MYSLKYLGAIVAFCLVLNACGGSGDDGGSNTDNTAIINDDENIEGGITRFLSYKAPCYGIIQRLCLVTGGNEFFYEPIDGFDFVWGHTYELSLIETTLENPPQDASSSQYELEKIISDSEDSIGNKYEYERVVLLDYTFTKESGVYYFLGQSFSCQENVDCDGLVSINNSGGSVNVIFEYIGNGEILLVQWN